MGDLHVVVLAAGKGTRMRSTLPKVLHQAAGLPLIGHILRTAEALQPASTTIVVGHQAEQIKESLGKRLGLGFASQEPQLGTGHALLQTEPTLRGARGTLLLLSGDVPLLTPKTLETLVERHAGAAAAATVVTAIVDDPRGYGRIVRVGEQIARIVEEK